MLIFYCFRALAYTTFDRLCAVFLYNLKHKHKVIYKTKLAQ